MLRHALSIWLLALFSVAGAAGAGAAEKAVAGPASDETWPTPDEIKTLQENAKNAGDIDKAVQEQLQDLYKQALDQLELAAQWSTKAQEFRASQAEAPNVLKRLNAELARPSTATVIEPGTEADLQVLEQRLILAESALEAENRSLLDLRAEKARRADRRIEVPNLLTTAKERLEKLSLESRSIATLADRARDVLNRARRYALVKEIDAYEQELLSYEVRGDLLEKRLEAAEQRVETQEQSVLALSQSIDENRSRLADAAVQEAEQDVQRAHPILRDLAGQNLQLTRLRGEIGEAIEAVKKQAAESDELIKQLDEDSTKIQGRVTAVGLTPAIGQFLRKHYASLPRERHLRRSIRKIHDDVGEVQARIIELEDQRSALDAESVVENMLTGLDTTTTESESQQIRLRALELVADQKTYLDELIGDYGTYFSELVDLDVSQRKLLAETRLFARYIEEKILWIRSGNVLMPADVLTAGKALLWLVHPDGWIATARSVVGTVRANPLLSTAFAIVIAFLFGINLRLRRQLGTMIKRCSERATASLFAVFKTLVATFSLAGTVPAILWFLAWLLATPYDTSEFAKAIATGLRSAAVIYFTIEILRHLCVDGGIGARIFKWKKAIRHPLLETLTWLQWIVIPGAFLAGVMDFQANEAFRNSLGRVAFVIPMIALAAAAYRIASPKSGMMAILTTAEQHKWLHQMRYILYAAAVGLPGGLAVAGLLGYYYTAYYLSWRIMETVWILLALLFLDTMGHYWLKVRIRQRTLEEAAEKARDDMSGKTQSVTVDGIQVPIEEEELDAATISTQTNQILRTVVVLGAIAGAWTIWSNTLPALSVLDEIQLWSTSVETAETITKPDGTSTVSRFTQQVPITLTDLGLSIVLIVVAFVAARNLPGLMEIALLERLPLVPSVRYAITSLSKYTIAAIGIVLAFNAIGISWSKIQWLVAAMTVGLAFGLQEIFANLVSGIIILFERPIRVGDVVTVGNVSGTVSKIRIRATVITDWDRKELIVPNKHFITQQILNWTLSDAIIRVIFPVSVSRGSDASRVKEILVALAFEHPLVLKEPEPSAIFKGFGPGALMFDLRVFIRREDYAMVLDAVNMAIEEGLKKADIEIAVDRQEIQVRPAKEARGKEGSSPFLPQPDES